MEYLNKVIYDVSNIERYTSIVLYSVIGFFLPMLLSHPQLLVGSVVNMTLVLAAFNLKKWDAIPLCVLPTFGVVAHGLLFGPFTILVLYMMPFIWVGNWLLIFGIKKFYVDKEMNYAISLPISILIKTALLFSAAFVLVKLSLLPVMFLTVMGMFQIYTALIGGVAAYSILRIRKLMMI